MPLVELLRDPTFRMVVNIIIVSSCLYLVWRIVVIRGDGYISFSRSWANWAIAFLFIGTGGNAANVSVVYTLAPQVNTLLGLPTPIFYTIGDILGAVPFIVLALIALRYPSVKIQELGKIINMTEGDLQDKLDKQIEDNRRLEQANEQLKHYISVFSHELRTPITGVAGLMEVLVIELNDTNDKHPGIVDNSIDLAKTIQGVAIQGNQLMTGLSEYSNVVQGGGKFESKLQNIGTVIKQVIDSLSLEIAEAKGVVNWEPDQMPAVFCPVLISQVFSNLLRNSIRFKSERPLRVDISVTRTESHYQFSVSDNGIGFDMGNIDRVFAPLGSAHGPELMGQGIGLAISKVIIERGGGNFTATSKVGQGATFGFAIPKNHSIG